MWFFCLFVCFKKSFFHCCFYFSLFLYYIFLYRVDNVNITGSLTNFQLFKQVSVVLCIPSNVALKSVVRSWWHSAVYFALWHPSFAFSLLAHVTGQMNGWPGRIGRNEGPCSGSWRTCPRLWGLFRIACTLDPGRSIPQASQFSVKPSLLHWFRHEVKQIWSFIRTDRSIFCWSVTGPRSCLVTLQLCR